MGTKWLFWISSFNSDSYHSTMAGKVCLLLLSKIATLGVFVLCNGRFRFNDRR